MTVLFQAKISKADLDKYPSRLFVFGDNAQRAGNGGTAAWGRGAPNAIGIITKKAPSMRAAAFMTDEQFIRNVSVFMLEWRAINEALMQGKVVVIPSGLPGSGLAMLPEKAPRTFVFMLRRWAQLVDLHGLHEQSEPIPLLLRKFFSM